MAVLLDLDLLGTIYLSLYLSILTISLSINRLFANGHNDTVYSLWNKFSTITTTSFIPDLLLVLTNTSLASAADINAVIDSVKFCNDIIKNTNNVEISCKLAANLIQLNGLIQDSDGAVAVLMRCAEQDTLISDENFTITNQMLYLKCEYSLIIDLLNHRLVRIDEITATSSASNTDNSTNGTKSSTKRYLSNDINDQDIRIGGIYLSIYHI
jgi:hypothetical protein